MAGLLRKSMLYLGLVDDDEGLEDYDDEPGEVLAGPAVQRYTADGPPVVRRPAPATPSRAAPVTQPPPVTSSPAYRITTLQPRTYNEARSIGEHFREGVPVIMNLTEMDDGDAKRLVDFAAGLIFGLRGSIERVTNKVFLLSPRNVSVSAEDKARIAEGGFFNQS
ncbi:MAG: cell division protein SepF [Mycobacteriales bacterium]